MARYVLVDADVRDGHVAVFPDLVSRARPGEGCIYFAGTADSVDPERINTVEVWRDSEALDAWRKRADAPDLEEPKYMAVKRYDAVDGDPLF